MWSKGVSSRCSCYRRKISELRLNNEKTFSDNINKLLCVITGTNSKSTAHKAPRDRTIKISSLFKDRTGELLFVQCA